MASKFDVKSIWPRFGYQGDSMWQQELCKYDREPNVPWQIKEHINTILLYKGYGTKGSYQAPVCEYRWASCWCTDQASISIKVWIFLW